MRVPNNTLNLSFLFDESKGRGTLAANWPGVAEAAGVPFGYAGGLGPENVAAQLARMALAAHGAPVWVDMESSLRTVRQRQQKPLCDGAGGTVQRMVDENVFDVGKAVRCLEAAVDFGVRIHGETFSASGAPTVLESVSQLVADVQATDSAVQRQAMT